MKKLVISGINLIDGGALSVYYDLLDSLIEKKYFNNFKIIALVGNKKLFSKYKKHIELMEFSKSKKSWLFRLYYEFIFFKKLSKKIKADIWLSLHDITPNVIANRRYVYCHNPSPFNKMSIKEIKYGIKYYLFAKFYKYLYRINIRKNAGIIVQQQWIRNEFEKMYKVDNVIVARPSISNIEKIINKDNTERTLFIYPSYPRYYKNFEVLCEATKILNQKNIQDYEVIITIDGTENNYSKGLIKRYSDVDNIRFIGIIDRKELYSLYGKSDCLIFMSKLETWGMPIIEYKTTNKAMILSDLPYSYETIGEYDNVAFVEVDNYVKLAEKMLEIINDKKNIGKNTAKEYMKPFANDWNELIEIILDDGDIKDGKNTI